MLDRCVDQWVELCNHFNSDKFRKASSANIENRSKKKYNHRTGSRPLSYIVEEMTVILSVVLDSMAHEHSPFVNMKSLKFKASRSNTSLFVLYESRSHKFEPQERHVE
ncbi:Uncharacterized protein Fot_04114 [Forsythia ovata]|uniref:Uncharacterized protein n=1 Tax=Forsythia ovata TaxID=205694 RepID=A0ABD1XCI4_9LAMI